jgi:hypothetical protein
MHSAAICGGALTGTWRQIRSSDFSAPVVAAPRLGNTDRQREDATELRLDLSFSVRWDEHDRRWTATATLADGTILHAEPSPHSAPAAAAELWQQMARKIRERLPEKPNRYGG